MVSKKSVSHMKLKGKSLSKRNKSMSSLTSFWVEYKGFIIIIDKGKIIVIIDKKMKAKVLPSGKK